MAIYFYHFTNEKAYKAMTGRGKPWKCQINQPQKSAWYGDQHEKGFYVTVLSSEQINAKTARKTGGGVSKSTHVLVFEFLTVTEKNLKSGEVKLTGDTASIKLVGSPAKYRIKNIGPKKNENDVTFSKVQCICGGAIGQCIQFQNDQKIVDRMKAISPPKQQLPIVHAASISVDW